MTRVKRITQRETFENIKKELYSLAEAESIFDPDWVIWQFGRGCNDSCWFGFVVEEDEDLRGFFVVEYTYQNLKLHSFCNVGEWIFGVIEQQVRLPDKPLVITAAREEADQLVEALEGCGLRATLEEQTFVVTGGEEG